MHLGSLRQDLRLWAAARRGSQLMAVLEHLSCQTPVLGKPLQQICQQVGIAVLYQLLGQPGTQGGKTLPQVAV